MPDDKSKPAQDSPPAPATPPAAPATGPDKVVDPGRVEPTSTPAVQTVETVFVGDPPVAKPVVQQQAVAPAVVEVPDPTLLPTASDRNMLAGTENFTDEDWAKVDVCPHCHGPLIPHNSWWHCNRCGCRFDQPRAGTFVERPGHPVCTLIYQRDELNPTQRDEYDRLSAVRDREVSESGSAPPAAVSGKK